MGFERSATLSTPDNGLTAPFLLRDGVPPLDATAAVRDASFGAVPVGRPQQSDRARAPGPGCDAAGSPLPAVLECLARVADQRALGLSRRYCAGRRTLLRRGQRARHLHLLTIPERHRLRRVGPRRLRSGTTWHVIRRRWRTSPARRSTERLSSVYAQNWIIGCARPAIREPP